MIGAMRPLLPLLLLAACAEFPVLDARIPPAERTAAPPPLLPLTGLLASAQALPASPGFEGALSAEAARLQAQAAAIPAPSGTTEAERLEALRTQAAAIPAPAGATDAERLAALQARAEALRDGVLSDEERARLGSGASLP